MVAIIQISLRKTTPRLIVPYTYVYGMYMDTYVISGFREHTFAMRMDENSAPVDDGQMNINKTARLRLSYAIMFNGSFG